MKIKENYLLRQVADNWVVLPVGDATINFNGMISLNETGALLWKELEQGADMESLVSILTDKYGINKDLAIRDIERFVHNLRRNQMLED